MRLILSIHLLDQPLRCRIHPRHDHGGFGDGNFDSCEAEEGRPALSPCTAGGRKRSRVIGHELPLLVGFEFDHAPLHIVAGEERSENLAAHPKVGMTHVPDFGGFRQAQGTASKSIGSHGEIIDWRLQIVDWDEFVPKTVPRP